MADLCCNIAGVEVSGKLRAKLWEDCQSVLGQVSKSLDDLDGTSPFFQTVATRSGSHMDMNLTSPSLLEQTFYSILSQTASQFHKFHKEHCKERRPWQILVHGLLPAASRSLFGERKQFNFHGNLYRTDKTAPSHIQAEGIVHKG